MSASPRNSGLGRGWLGRTACHVWAVEAAGDGMSAHIALLGHANAGPVALVDIVDKECREDRVGRGKGDEGGR